MIKIKIHSLLTPERFEVIEDKLRDLFEEMGISATIDDEITGNTTQTRDDMKEKILELQEQYNNGDISETQYKDNVYAVEQGEL